MEMVQQIRLILNNRDKLGHCFFEYCFQVPANKMGFVETNQVVTDIGGGFVMDDYIMTKEL